MQRMRDEGVQTSIHYQPIDTLRPTGRRASVQRTTSSIHTSLEKECLLFPFPEHEFGPSRSRQRNPETSSECDGLMWHFGAPATPLHLCFVGWGDHVHVERWQVISPSVATGQHRVVYRYRNILAAWFNEQLYGPARDALEAAQT